MNNATSSNTKPYTRAEIKALENSKVDPRIFGAALEFRSLQNRDIHPPGKFDNAGRFYLKNKCACCDVRAPSRAFPHTQMVHGRTATHVAHANGIPEFESEIRGLARVMGKRKVLQTGPQLVLVVLANIEAQAALKGIQKGK